MAPREASDGGRPGNPPRTAVASWIGSAEGRFEGYKLLAPRRGPNGRGRFFAFLDPRSSRPIPALIACVWIPALMSLYR